jgi:hypothetical protein
MLDRDLLTELQLTLIEPPDGGDTWPSLIWTRDEVLDALNAGLRALYHDVHLQVSGIHIPVAALSTRIALPADWLATVLIVWRDIATRRRTPLGPVDSFEGDLAVPGWEVTPGAPLAFADLDSEQRTVRLVPTPASAGLAELLYISTPPLTTGTAPGTKLPLADEFVSGVKYAALSTLLRKVGRLLDPERAEYCDRRYDLTRTAAEIILGGWS